MQVREFANGHEKSQPERVIVLHGYGARERDVRVPEGLFPSHFEIHHLDLSCIYSHSEHLTFSQQIAKLENSLKEQFGSQAAFHLTGFSYGGALAWGLAIRLKEQCRSLSLVNPMGPSPARSFRSLALKFLVNAPLNPIWINRLLNSSVGRWSVYYLMGLFGRKKRLLKSGRSIELISRIVFGFCEATKNERWDLWTEQLKQSQISTLLVQSENDPIFMASSFDELAIFLRAEHRYQIPGRKHLLKGADLHLAYQEISDFVRSHDQQSLSA